ncbi:TPA: hypothetical protein ACGOZ1_001945 [Streptococcus suis]
MNKQEAIEKKRILSGRGGLRRRWSDETIIKVFRIYSDNLLVRP